MDEDCAGLEDSDRFGSAPVEKGRDLGIRICRDEAAAELVAIADADRPGIIFGIGMAPGEQLLEHDRDLLPVWRREGIELERVLPHGELLVMRRTGDRTVNAGELAAAGLLPGPDRRENIAVGVGH